MRSSGVKREREEVDLPPLVPMFPLLPMLDSSVKREPEEEKEVRHSASALVGMGMVADFVRVPTTLGDLGGGMNTYRFISRRAALRQVPVPPEVLNSPKHPDDSRPEIRLLNAIDDDDIATVADMLAKHKAAVNRLDLEFSPHDEGGVTSLIAAFNKNGANSTSIARLLVDAGSNVNAANRSGWTPLLAAANNGNIEAVKWLTSIGADMLRTVSGGFSLLHIVARAPGDNVAYVKHLVEKTPLGNFISKRDSDTMTPLANAAESGNLNICKYLRPLTSCSTRSGRKKKDYFRSFFDSDDEEDDKDAGDSDDEEDDEDAGDSDDEDNDASEDEEDDGDDDDSDDNDNEGLIKTALHCASEKGHAEVVDYLLATMYDCGLVDGELEVFVTDDNDQTPLHLAVIGGHASVVEALMEAQSDANRRDIMGLTPLHHAALHATQSLELVTALFSYFDDEDVPFPIDATLTTQFGARQSAVELARERGNYSAAAVIAKYAQRRRRKPSWC